MKQARKTEAEKLQILSGWERSELKQKEYAHQAGVGLSTLGLWLRQAHKKKPRARLVEVEVAGGVPGVGRYGLRLSSGIGLEIASGFDAGELRGLLQILREEF